MWKTLQDTKRTSRGTDFETALVLSGVKAVIFDLDGVILESGDIKTQAFLQVFAAYPEHRDAILKHHLANLGVSRYDKFAWVYRELLRQPFGETERNCLGQNFSDLVLEQVLACPFVLGAREALAALYGEKLLFVASGTPQEELDLILEQRGIANYFRGAWGTPLKKPETVEHVLREYELNRDAVLFVGDGTSDYEAAISTGIEFIARETPEQEPFWKESGVNRVQDLRPFACTAALLETLRATARE